MGFAFCDPYPAGPQDKTSSEIGWLRNGCRTSNDILLSRTSNDILLSWTSNDILLSYWCVANFPRMIIYWFAEPLFDTNLKRNSLYQYWIRIGESAEESYQRFSFLLLSTRRKNEILWTKTKTKTNNNNNNNNNKTQNNVFINSSKMLKSTSHSIMVVTRHGEGEEWEDVSK